MARPITIEPVRLFTGLIYGEEGVYPEALDLLEKKFGKVEFESEKFPFDHTDYYSNEMGDDLKRGFVSFAQSLQPDGLKEAKLTTVKIEKKLAGSDNHRRINIDPGIISLANMILASTKDYAQRIYLGDGVYAEVSMIYQNKIFSALPWSYPDYRRPEVAEFLLRVRGGLKDEIIALRNI